jgi:hypothetical protein
VWRRGEGAGARERTKGQLRASGVGFIGRGGGRGALVGEGMDITAMGAPVFKAFKGRGLDGGERVGD